MLWSTLRVITESKAFWSLNGLFFVVPLLDRIGVPIGWQLFCLYLAAWLLLTAGVFYAIQKPRLILHSDFNAYKTSGHTAQTLSDTFLQAGGDIKSVVDTHIQNKLNNETNTDAPDPKAFWYVYNFIDTTGLTSRRVILGLMSGAVALLFTVNVARFVSVTTSFFQPEKDHAMNIPHSYHLSTGGSVDAVHDNGSGESTTTLGTLLDLDDAGYVVIKIKDGKLVYIPKGRVIKITQLSD